MNIFVLDKDPIKCAKLHCNAHVNKMITESAQMLCTAHWVLNKKAPYKKTHVNHRCNVWVRESRSNYLWLCFLAKSLCNEYTFRYSKIHKTEKVVNWALSHIPAIEDKGITPFAQSMPDEYKHSNIVTAYRNYYLGEKSHLFKYKNRAVPRFIKKSGG